MPSLEIEVVALPESKPLTAAAKSAVVDIFSIAAYIDFGENPAVRGGRRKTELRSPLSPTPVATTPSEIEVVTSPESEAAESAVVDVFSARGGDFEKLDSSWRKTELRSPSSAPMATTTSEIDVVVGV